MTTPTHPLHPTNAFKFRIVPWWTDGCSTFLNNLFKWLPHAMPRTSPRSLTALEFGSGNSTLYLLTKGVRVVTIESDDAYIALVCNIAKEAGYQATAVDIGDFSQHLLDQFHLVAIKATSFAQTNQILTTNYWDFVVNDGISRREVIEEIHRSNLNSIVILDNVEYCANWGHLDRSSAKPELLKAYRAILRDRTWNNLIFEQPEGRADCGAADKVGWESPHRWASAVLWPERHFLTPLMVTTSGLPMVNPLGADNTDVQTLEDRCPFDWNQMKWLKPPFPTELDLKLHRDFD
jgi:predicted O-methyltransferase YrrM